MAEWLTSEQAAAHLGLPSAAAVRKRVERGQLRGYRIGRQLRFRLRDLEGALTDAMPRPGPARQRLSDGRFRRQDPETPSGA